MQLSFGTSGRSSPCVPESLPQPASAFSAGKSPTAAVITRAQAVPRVGAARQEMTSRPQSVAHGAAQPLPHQDRPDPAQGPAADSQVDKVPGCAPAEQAARPEQDGLRLAVSCLSCQQTPEDQDRICSLFDREQTDEFFYDCIAFRHAHCGLPLPDPLHDAPLMFALKSLAIDRGASAAGRCTSYILQQALEAANVPVAFTLLKGLQDAMRQGFLDRCDLEDQRGRTLLEGTFFYEQLNLDWCRLVLAAGIFDVNPASSPPLCRAISLSQDTAAIEALLEAGADPCVPDDITGEYPLVLCVRKGAGRLAQLDALLGHPRVDPNQISGRGPQATTALHQAISRGHIDLADRLLQHPATHPDVFCPASCGSPLAAAAVSFLLKRKEPDTMVRFLAQQGGRLIIASPAGDPIDCGHDLGRFRKLCGNDAIRAVTPDRTQQLHRALEQGRKAGRCKGESWAGRKRGRSAEYSRRIQPPETAPC